MKYYCEKCECVFELSEKAELAFRQSDLDNDDADEKWDGERLLCDICSEDHEVWMKRIPDYETVKQWEKRMDRYFPDYGLVFVFSTGMWAGYEWKYAKRRWGDYDFPIVVADPPVPPPNNWRPQ